MTERPLDSDALMVFTDAHLLCLELLGLDREADPKRVVYAVDALADAWQQGSRPGADVLDPTDEPYVMGSAWADQLVRAFGWDWVVVVNQDEGWDAPAVVSPDRGFAVYPFAYLIGCFADPTIDITIALAFNMLAAGKVGVRDADEYFNLMGGVRRLVPRR